MRGRIFFLSLGLVTGAYTRAAVADRFAMREWPCGRVRTHRAGVGRCRVRTMPDGDESGASPARFAREEGATGR